MKYTNKADGTVSQAMLVTASTTATDIRAFCKETGRSFEMNFVSTSPGVVLKGVKGKTSQIQRDVIADPKTGNLIPDPSLDMWLVVNAKGAMSFVAQDVFKADYTEGVSK